MTTILDTRPAPTGEESGPVDETLSNAILFRAAAACEDDVLTELAAARQTGDEQAVARLTAERDLFDGLAVALRGNRPATASA